MTEPSVCGDQSAYLSKAILTPKEFELKIYVREIAVTSEL
jgi:hypothetical protein